MVLRKKRALVSTTSSSSSSSSSTPKPSKHSVNRFQRCYSDGAHGSPKRKRKVGKATKSIKYYPETSQPAFKLSESFEAE